MSSLGGRGFEPRPYLKILLVLAQLDFTGAQTDKCANMAAGFGSRLDSSSAGFDSRLDAAKAPNGFYMLHPPGANNTRYPTNFMYGCYGTGDMCKEMYHDLSIGVQTCGKIYNTHRTRTKGKYGSPVEKTAVLDCGTGAGAVTGGFAILSCCAKTCVLTLVIVRVKKRPCTSRIV